MSKQYQEINYQYYIHVLCYVMTSTRSAWWINMFSTHAACLRIRICPLGTYAFTLTFCMHNRQDNNNGFVDFKTESCKPWSNSNCEPWCGHKQFSCALRQASSLLPIHVWHRMGHKTLSFTKFAYDLLKYFSHGQRSSFIFYIRGPTTR